MGGCVSDLTLAYLVPVFRAGGTRPLTDADVPALPAALRARAAARAFDKAWSDEKAKPSRPSRPSRPSLLRALVRAFCAGSGGRVWIVVALSLVFCAAVTTSPYFVNRLVRFFQGEAPQTVAGVIPTGYFWALGTWSCFAVVSFCVTHIYTNTTRMGHMARLAVINGVYRKALRLSSAAGKEGGSAYVNLMTVDAERIWQGFLKMHLPGNTVLVVLIGCAELYVTAGLAGLAAILVLVCFLPVQTCVARGISRTRRMMSAATDTRVQLQTELLSGIRVVKAYGWEPMLEQQVARLRAREEAQLRRLLFLRSTNQVITFLAPSVAMAAVFLLYSIDRWPLNCQHCGRKLCATASSL